MSDKVFVVVGGGQAGGWIIKTLREQGFTGRIVLIGAERHPPYERPPLSKSLLRDAGAIGETALLSMDDLAGAGVEARLSEHAVRVERANQIVDCESGWQIRYDRLFLATGSRPRIPDWLSGVQSDRVHLLRTIDDAAGLRNALSASPSLLIVGGGWIGLEVASSARELGAPVTVLESASRLCQRSVPEPVSHWLAELHLRHGVHFVFGRTAAKLVERPSDIELELDDGTTLSAGQLLVCVGAVPNTALAEKAGLETSNGILVDEAGRTSDERIFAAGDVASFPCCYAGQMTRRESWANAQNQAIVVAKAALGQDVSYADLPWLWSNQYHHNIQIAGLPERAAQIFHRRGPTAESGCWLGLDGNGNPVGAIGVDAPKLFRPVLKALKDRASLELTQWEVADIRRGEVA